MRLAIDLDGALMYSRPFKEAHVKWFEVMANLLNDELVKEYANKDNYFQYVHEVMKRYLGDVDEKSRTLFARNLYAMATVAQVQKKDVVVEFVEFLRSIKGRCELVLVTTAPAASVESILEKIGCIDLFDSIIKDRMDEEPDKKPLLQRAGNVDFYIGEGDENMTTCKELGIKSISVNWVNTAKIKGDSDVQTLEDLKHILKL